MLKSIQIIKQQNIEKRTKAKNDIELSGQLRHELLNKLDMYLESNDTVKFEVSDARLGMFVDLLDDKLLADYEYFQDTENTFIFKKRVINI